MRDRCRPDGVLGASIVLPSPMALALPCGAPLEHFDGLIGRFQAASGGRYYQSGGYLHSVVLARFRRGVPHRPSGIRVSSCRFYRGQFVSEPPSMDGGPDGAVPRIHLWLHTIERFLKPAQFSEQLGQGWASAWCLAWLSTRSWRSLTTCTHHQAQYSEGHKPCR